MPITITENGPDLLLTNTKTNQHMYLRNPTWKNLFDTLRNFTDIDKNEPGSATSPIVGEYDYVWQFKEHELTLYPRRATPNGWIATHLGTEFKPYVKVLEYPNGTIFIVRSDLDLWITIHDPQPGTFFEHLHALSAFEKPNLEWSFDDIGGEVVALVDSEPYRKNEVVVLLYPDSWGKSMRMFVAGSQL